MSLRHEDSESLNRGRAARLTSEQRKAELLGCAIEAFSEKGFGRSTHSDVAQLAGVAIPTIFHYFATREQLLEAVLTEVSRFVREDLLMANFSQEKSAAEIIEDTLMAFVAAAASHENYMRIWFEWGSSIRDDLRNSYKALYNDELAHFSRVLEQDKESGALHLCVSAEHTSQIIAGLSHMLIRMKFAGNPESALKHAVGTLVQIYLS